MEKSKIVKTLVPNVQPVFVRKKGQNIINQNYQVASFEEKN